MVNDEPDILRWLSELPSNGIDSPWVARDT